VADDPEVGEFAEGSQFLNSLHLLSALEKTIVYPTVSSMSKPRQNSGFLGLDDTHFGARQRKVVPHEFVLDAIAPLLPETRPMFGRLATCVEDKIIKIMLILRGERDNMADNGVWLATTEEHDQSLRRQFPNMRSIRVFGRDVTG